jgi:carbamoyl-phosphate synthase/aspartate carbamoyltransferase/dihydroorotase
MHVHLREPGATDKEDFTTGTMAAVAGGVVAVMDMPNNPGNPTNSGYRLAEKFHLAEDRVYSDIGFYYGAKPEDNNLRSFKSAADRAMGLKSYLEVTTGSDHGSEPRDFTEIWHHWHDMASTTQPIILHAEERTIEEALAISAGTIGHPTHVAHVSNRAELEAVIRAKHRGWPVTCGVTPHHLLMNETDVHDWYQRMKPPLATPDDQAFLRHFLGMIDVVETDHAPHTIEEKEAANQGNPEGREDLKPTSYGVPGLEAMLPLLLHELKHGRLERNELVRLTSTRPREILGLPPTSNHTWVRASMDDYEFGVADVQSKCGWSPYLGRLVTGRVLEVSKNGHIVYRNGLPTQPPTGRALTPSRQAR